MQLGLRTLTAVCVQIRVVVRQVMDSCLESCLDPADELSRQSLVVIDSGAAAANQRSEFRRGQHCGLAQIPEPMSDEGPRMPGVLNPICLGKMKSIPMLDPLAMRTPTVEVIAAPLLPIAT